MTIQQHLEAGAVAGLNLGSQVLEQGFHLPPLQIVGQGVVEDAFQGMQVFVAHGGLLPEAGAMQIKAEGHTTNSGSGRHSIWQAICSMVEGLFVS